MLLEPSRTNLITYSQDFSQWATQSGGTGSAPIITSNSAISPDGTQNAHKIVFNKGTGVSTSDLSVIASSSFTTQTNTASFYIKADSPQKIVFRNSTNWQLVDVTTEWQRIDKTDTGNGVQIGLRDGYGISGVPNTATIYLWGAQIEQSSYPTSYIPTQGSAVTRLADNTKIVNSPILQATNQFTLFFDAKDFINYGTTFANIMFTLGAGESAYDVGTGIHIYNKIWYYFNGSSAVTLGDCYNATTDSKFAISYDGTKFTRYANGVKLGTNTVSASMSNWDTLTNGNLSYSGVDRVFDLADLKLYDTALTDQEAIALTQV